MATAAADDAGGLDTALLGDFLATVTDAAATGRRLRTAELERYGERGAAAATGGVALRALVDLYLSASWRLWRELPVVQDGSAAQVRAAGLAVLRAADDGVAALAEGFQLARRDLARRQESARREVFDALLAGGPEATAMLGRAADLGLDLAAPHAVLVAVGRTGSAGSAPDLTASPSLIGAVERSLQGRHGDATVLVDRKGSELVCIFAAPDESAVAFVAGQVARVLDREIDRDPVGDTVAAPVNDPVGAAAGPGRRWQAATSSPLTGPDGVRGSYDQARDTLELAARLQLPAAVVDAGSLAVFRVLLRDRAAIDALIVSALGPLASARGGAGPLLQTLEVYYVTGGVATETARRLHLSVRAVTYRLARVRQLLGVDPTDPAQRFALQAAVLGARLLDWPAVPLPSGS